LGKWCNLHRAVRKRLEVIVKVNAGMAKGSLKTKKESLIEESGKMAPLKINFIMKKRKNSKNQSQKRKEFRQMSKKIGL
jgi:hypothetical protein